MLVTSFKRQTFAGVSVLLFALLLGKSATTVAQGDISVRQGEFEVFYSAFNTSFLSPEVAAAIPVVRARNRGLLNISVVKHTVDGTQVPVAASNISGESFDLLHRRKLEFQEVIETGARYYLAPFKITNDNELIVFDVQVVPRGSEQAITLKIERRFFHN
ncbi:MAG: DUF4426 domain-containing protein [Pseudomonadales bacterium]|nr:DUF4426 domain-containing protein [Pseudomonadales bacterium]